MTRGSFVIAALCVIAQYYDYHLFGFLAAKISTHFFSTSDPIIQLMRTYIIMFIGVTAKPIGAIILGRIGDTYGRFATMLISLSGTAFASLVISLTPSYNEIGVFSALILLLCRMCVASLVSSGTDGIRLYIYEKISQKKQCLGNGAVTFSTQLGSFIAALSAWFFSLDFMPEYSWRIAFMTGTLMGLAAIYIRLKFFQESEEISKSDPNYDLYKDHNSIRIATKNFKLFLYCSILAGCIGSTYQFIIIFFGTYNFQVLKIVPHYQMQFYTSIGVMIYMCFAIIGGICADYLGKKLVSNIATFLLFIVTILFTLMVKFSQFSLSLYLLLIMLIPFITMPALAYLKQSIPKSIRYRLFSLAHATGSMFISAPTAFLSTYLYYSTGVAWIPMIYFLTTIIIMIYIINKLDSICNTNSL
ncbi:MAG: MFS transporter [Rickettsiaceae bacterium]|nr:MFS transporter [Rickettsiaceae bacterium]